MRWEAHRINTPNRSCSQISWGCFQYRSFGSSLRTSQVSNLVPILSFTPWWHPHQPGKGRRRGKFPLQNNCQLLCFCGNSSHVLGLLFSYAKALLHSLAPITVSLHNQGHRAECRATTHLVQDQFHCNIFFAMDLLAEKGAQLQNVKASPFPCKIAGGWGGGHPESKMKPGYRSHLASS